MYLRHLKVENCKLMRALEASFVNDDGTTRMWTVFVGENGTCKTTLLRTIAVAAAGSAFANRLVGDPGSYLDKRGDEVSADVNATFGFSALRHSDRTYPGREDVDESSQVMTRAAFHESSVHFVANYDSPVAAMTSVDRLSQSEFDSIFLDHFGTLAPDKVALVKAFLNPRRLENPVDLARNQELPYWFVAAYGTGRVLSAPLQQTEGSPPQRERLENLFDRRILPMGTGFSDELLRRFGEERAKAFSVVLREALVDRLHTPNLQGVNLQVRGTATKEIALIDAHSFEMRAGTGTVKLPAVWLSQGYQAVVSLVADIIGHVWLDAGAEVPLDDMEGLVLVDEIDLHLHPKWQTEIVRGLKRTFPKMQFIVTTHSPLVLAGCERGEVLMLVQDPETGDVTAQRKDDVLPMLLTASELNSEFFGVERASQLSEDLRRYVEIAGDRYRSDEEDVLARSLLAKLRGHGVEISFEPLKRVEAP